MPDYALVDRFWTDDGELTGQSPEEAFVLGVEFWIVRCEVVDDANEFERAVHPANEERIRKLCLARRRQCHMEPLAEGWLTLRVEAASKPTLRLVSELP